MAPPANTATAGPRSTVKRAFEKIFALPGLVSRRCRRAPHNFRYAQCLEQATGSYKPKRFDVAGAHPDEVYGAVPTW